MYIYYKTPLLHQHWESFGRHYYSRHDYEEIPSEDPNDIYKRTEKILPTLIEQKFEGALQQLRLRHLFVN